MAEEENAELIARKIFMITMVCAVLFIGTVFVFILPNP
jgi:hypothetical protein